MASAESGGEDQPGTIIVSRMLEEQSVKVLTCGLVSLPEFLSKPVELNSDHVPTEILLAYERYAASLIFLSGHIHQNELLPRLHACS